MEKKGQPVETGEASAGQPDERDISAELGDRTAEVVESLRAELEEAKNKYLRLYAEFDNYKKKALREKEEFVKYSNESLIYELLPVLDNLEMALKHSAESNANALQSLVQGVGNTQREFNRVLEKFGLTAIEAVDKPFDPAFHHAMSQVERADTEGNRVVEEFRKGYLYREKVLRPSLVSVSKKPEEGS